MGGTRSRALHSFGGCRRSRLTLALDGLSASTSTPLGKERSSPSTETHPKRRPGRRPCSACPVGFGLRNMRHLILIMRCAGTSPGPGERERRPRRTSVLPHQATAHQDDRTRIQRPSVVQARARTYEIETACPGWSSILHGRVRAGRNDNNNHRRAQSPRSTDRQGVSAGRDGADRSQARIWGAGWRSRAAAVRTTERAPKRRAIATPARWWRCVVAWERKTFPSPSLPVRVFNRAMMRGHMRAASVHRRCPAAAAARSTIVAWGDRSTDGHVLSPGRPAQAPTLCSAVRARYLVGSIDRACLFRSTADATT